MVIATLQVAQVIILESFLSFLGLGIKPPTPAWGNMLGEGRLYMLNSWWIATFPGLAIFVATLAINLDGQRAARLARPAPETLSFGGGLRPPSETSPESGLRRHSRRSSAIVRNAAPSSGVSS